MINNIQRFVDMDLDKISKRINDIKPDVLSIKKDIKDAIEIAKIRPEMSVASLRKITESILCDIYEIEYKQPPKETIIQKVKNQLLSKGVLPRRIKNHVDTIQDFGNMSIHHQAGDIETEDIEMCFNSLASIYKWYVDKYAYLKEDNTTMKTPTNIKNKPDEIYMETDDTKTEADKAKNQSYVDRETNPHKTKKKTNLKKKKSSKAKVIIPILILLAGAVFAIFSLPELLDKNNIGNVTDEDEDVNPQRDRFNDNYSLKMDLEASQRFTNKIVLDWKDTDKNINYRVYKKVMGRTEYQTITNTSESEYQDEDVVNGINYSYKIEAIENGDTIGFEEINGTTSISYNSWVDLSPIMKNIPPKRRNFSMATMKNNRIVIFGGRGEEGLLNDMWLYDAQKHYWEEIKTNANPPAREFHSMVGLNDNRLLLFGGRGDDGNFDDTWIYDDKNNRWIQHSQNDGQSPSARSYHAMAYDGQNSVILFGGGQQTSRGYYSDLYEFNINANRWVRVYDSETASTDRTHYPQARIYHSLNQIAQSRIILFGGYDGKRNLGDTWLFTTNNKRWQKLDSDENLSRNLHAVTSPKNGKLLMTGGYNNNALNNTWIFDLGKREWEKENNTSLPSGIHSHAIELLSKNTVLMFGGINHKKDLVNNTYIYFYKEK